MTTLERPVYTPVVIGPTWTRDKHGKFILPKHTLGWEILGWTAEWLQFDPVTPWEYTNEQVRFLLWWYAIDERGKFVYRDGVLQRLKGWGRQAKTLLPQPCPS